MKAQLIILGCGHSTGVPRIDGNWGNCTKKIKNKRTRCSAIIKKGSSSILIDTSPDIKNQFLHNKIKNLSSVVFTHEHADQTNGLFELRPFFWKHKKKTNTCKHVGEQESDVWFGFVGREREVFSFFCLFVFLFFDFW